MKKIGLLLVFILGICSSAYAIVDNPILLEGCTAGDKKYQISGCGDQTSTCCSRTQGGDFRGSWTPFGGACCTGTKPATSQSCTTGGRSGTQTRTVTCNMSTGSWSTGSWGTCSASSECTSGQTSTSGCGQYYITISKKGYKEKTCSSSGFWGTCQCPASTGNGYHSGKPYCQGTMRPRPDLQVDGYDDSCWHGIWSDTSCSGICCCAGHTPYLQSGTGSFPGCKDSRGRIQAACVCQTPAQIAGY